jgi:hypothetical protein
MDRSYSALFERNSKDLEQINILINSIDADNKAGHIDILELNNQIELTNRVIASQEKNKCTRDELYKLEDQCAGFYVSKMEFNYFKE